MVKKKKRKTWSSVYITAMTLTHTHTVSPDIFPHRDSVCSTWVTVLSFQQIRKPCVCLSKCFSPTVNTQLPNKRVVIKTARFLLHIYIWMIIPFYASPSYNTCRAKQPLKLKRKINIQCQTLPNPACSRTVGKTGRNPHMNRENMETQYSKSLNYRQGATHSAT